MPGVMIHCEVECHSAVRGREDVPFALLLDMIGDSVKMCAKDDGETVDSVGTLGCNINLHVYAGYQGRWMLLRQRCWRRQSILTKFRTRLLRRTPRATPSRL